MDEAQARLILGETVRPDNSLDNGCDYVEWFGVGPIRLDASFEAEELEAIAWWMRNMEVKR